MALSLGWHIVFSCFGVAFPTMVVFAEWRGPQARQPGAARPRPHVGQGDGRAVRRGRGVGHPAVVRDGHPLARPDGRRSARSTASRSCWRASPSSSRRSSSASTCSAGTGCRRARTCCARCRSIVVRRGGRVLRGRRERLDEQPRRLPARPNGRVVDADPIGAMFGPSTPAAVRAHVIAAFMVTGFRVASVYAVGMLRGRARPLPPVRPADPADLRGDRDADPDRGRRLDRRHRRGEPAGQAGRDGGALRARGGAPLSLGGIFLQRRLHWALEIPYGLSLLVTHDPNGEVIGLQSVPPDQRPPVNVVHLAYNTMVGIGSALLLLALVVRLDVVAAPPDPEHGVVPARRRGVRRGARWSRWRPAGSPPRSAASRASSTGILRTADAVSPAPGLFARLLRRGRRSTPC